MTLSLNSIFKLDFSGNLVRSERVRKACRQGVSKKTCAGVSSAIQQACFFAYNAVWKPCSHVQHAASYRRSLLSLLVILIILIPLNTFAKANLCEKLMLEKGLTDFVRSNLIVSQKLLRKFEPQNIIKNGFLGTGFITEEKISYPLLKYLKTTLDSQINFWEIAVILGQGYADHIFDFTKRFQVKEIIDTIVKYQGLKAKTSQEETTVVFGTSGWREPR